MTFLFVLLFVSLTEPSSVQGQPKAEQQEESVFRGKTVSQWAEALKDEDVGVRSAAAFALGQIGPVANEAVPALKSLSEVDPTPAVRVAAKAALEKIEH